MFPILRNSISLLPFSQLHPTLEHTVPVPGRKFHVSSKILSTFLALILPLNVLAAEVRLHNVASIPLVHVYIMTSDGSGDGPDRLDGQPVSPGEVVHIEIPDDTCRVHFRLIWINGTSSEMVHHVCDSNGPFPVGFN